MNGIVNILDFVKVASHLSETQIDYALANFSVSHKTAVSESVPLKYLIARRGIL